MERAIERVTVIGAGIAGLTARAELSAAGFCVETIDKGRGPGGRTSRRRIDGYEFDHGAQYFTVRDPAFAATVKSWISQGGVQPWSARIGALSDGSWRPGGASTVRYVGVPGMNRPAGYLADAGRGPIHLGCRVAAITRDEHGTWRILDNGGQTVSSADAIVVTVPPPQALRLLDGLDAARAVLADADIEPCWAVMAVFEPPLEPGWDAAFMNGGPLAWVARNAAKPRRPAADAWVLHATGDWSRLTVEHEPERITGELLQALFRAAGVAPRMPLWAAAHRWRYARPRNRPVERFWWDPDQRLGLCGDWCAGGRIEGAFLSGRSLGHAIAAPR